MKDILYRQVWIPLNVNGDQDCKTLDNNQPLIIKSAEVMFRIGLFNVMPINTDQPGEFYNHSNLTAFVMRINTADYAGTSLMDSSVGGTVVFDPTVTESQFLAKERAPISIYCPSAITGITAGPQFLVFKGITSESAEPDAFGWGKITIKDLGLAAAAPPAQDAASYVTLDLFRAAIANCVRFGKNPAGRTATFVAPLGKKGMTLGAADNGGLNTKQENYP